MAENRLRETHSSSRVGGSVQRSDGRAVGFAEWGDREGRPVVMAHGGLGSRLVAPWFNEAAQDAGVRLVIIERPGFGLSDPAPPAPLVDWSEDVAAVVDFLDIDSFNVLGFSAGGPYALAVAAALGSRVENVVLVSSVGFVHEPTHPARVSLGARTLAAIGARAPTVLVPLMAAFVALARRGSQPLLEPDPPFEGATQHRYAGPIRDTIVGAQLWGFSPSAVSVPVRLWHGVDDSDVPLAHAEANARTLSQFSLHACDGEGHFLSAGTWQRALAGDTVVDR